MKKAAFFDIDGTLVQCMTQQELTKVLKMENLLSFSQIVSIYVWFFCSRIGFVKDSIQLRKKVYRVFGSRKKSEMDNIFKRTYEEYIRPKIRPEIRECVSKHINRGDLVFAISGTLESLCKPVCNEVGIKNLFATRLVDSNNRYTGEWEGDILEGRCKNDLIIKLAQEYQIDLTKSASYADSYTDLPMLQIVGEPIAVSPDHRLMIHSKKMSWKVING